MGNLTKQNQSTTNGEPKATEKISKLKLLELQLEQQININSARHRIKLIALGHIIYATSCLVLLSLSLILGAFFSFSVIDESDSDESKVESWIVVALRIFWFSVTGFFMLTFLLLCASVFLLRATRKNTINIYALAAIRFWQNITCILFLLDVATIFVFLQENELLCAAGYVIALGRIYFLVEVTRYRSYFETILIIMNEIDEFSYERFAPGVYSKNTSRKI